MDVSEEDDSIDEISSDYSEISSAQYDEDSGVFPPNLYYMKNCFGWYYCNICKESTPSKGVILFKKFKDGVSRKIWKHIKECHTTIYGRLRSDKLADRTEEQRAEESLDLIVKTDIPFSAINHPRFEKFCSYLARCTVTLPDPVIVRCVASRKFEDDKAKLREILRTVEKVSITTSTWISADDVGIFGITVHWIDHTWTLREHVLQVEVSASCHDSKDLSCILRRTLKDYNLCTKVHAITTKNTSDDRKIVANVQRYSESTIYHTPCMADVINLAVQKGLNELGNRAICSDEGYEECDDASRDKSQRPYGDTIDRLRKLIMEIKGSNESISCYEDLCEDVAVENKNLLDGDVRTDWNSTCDMIEAAWENRQVLDKLVKESSFISKAKFKISHEEWDLLKVFVNGLLPFREIAELLTKSKAIISSSVTRLYLLLLKHLDTTISDLDNPTRGQMGRILNSEQTRILKNAYALMKEKLLKYETHVKRRPMFPIAAVLDPKLKFKYIVPDEQEFVSQNLLRLLDKVPTLPFPSTRSVNRANSSTTASAKRSKVMIEFLELDEMGTKTLDTSARAEMENYLQQSCVDPHYDDSLQWWRMIGSKKYPRLAVLAKEFLSISATSSPSERIFSESGGIVSYKRDGLSPETASAMMTLKCWSHDNANSKMEEPKTV